MKNIVSKIILMSTIILVVSGCKKEEPFSKDYDINLPAAIVTSISDDKPFVGDTITLSGENLLTAQTVSIGAYNFTIVDKKDNSLTLIVPRVIDAGFITVVNAYKRSFTTEVSLQPQFYPAVITSWPAEIQRGKAFVLKGENIDLIKEVKVNGKLSSIVGSATPTQASFATAGIELGETAVIDVTPKAGEKQTSPLLTVIAPIDTYTPQQSLMLWDFETPPATTEGWGGSPFTASNGPGFFGKEYKVYSAAGNGWNGCYIRLTNDNGGNGFDLSAYNKPHITFLVNTYGKKGYVNPAITIAGTESDKHFTGQGGQYSDNYMIMTEGWEWRSYDLEAMGWADIIGKLDKVDMWFRGGNVGEGDEFEIALDQVMITDGPLTPSLIWDAEAPAGGDLPITFNGGTGLTGYSQGSKYASYLYTVGSDTWAWLGNIMAVGNLTLDPMAYSNGIYINFLVNTGDSEGYAGIQVEQNGNKAANQKLDPAYGDNYKFKPTNGAWEWRSMKFDIASWDNWGGTIGDINLAEPFNLSVYARGGNIASGVNAQLHMDYFCFTTVPLDPNLKPE